MGRTLGALIWPAAAALLSLGDPQKGDMIPMRRLLILCGAALLLSLGAGVALADHHEATEAQQEESEAQQEESGSQQEGVGAANPCGAKNPCNPCTPKNPCNPCAGKNPCGAKEGEKADAPE